MEVVDNRAHILRQIKQKADREIAKFKRKHAAELKAYEKEIDARTEKVLSTMDDEWNRVKEKLQRQQDSALDLMKTQKTLERQSQVYTNVKLHLEGQLKGDTLNEIVKSLLDRLNKAGKDFTEIHAPKGSSVNGTKPVLDDPRVVGIVSDNEEMEVSFDDLIHEHHAIIQQTITEELFR